MVCKLGAVEQWGVADPGKFLDHALQTFGADRVLFESNWYCMLTVLGGNRTKQHPLVIGIAGV